MRNVGAEAMEKLVAIRKEGGIFTSLDDLARARLPREGEINASSSNLQRPGHFDSLHENRREIFEALDQLLGQSDFYRREAQSLQSSLFGADSADAAPAFRFAAGPDWTQSNRLKLNLKRWDFIYPRIRWTAIMLSWTS